MPKARTARQKATSRKNLEAARKQRLRQKIRKGQRAGKDTFSLERHLAGKNMPKGKAATLKIYGPKPLQHQMKGFKQSISGRAAKKAGFFK